MQLINLLKTPHCNANHAIELRLFNRLDEVSHHERCFRTIQKIRIVKGGNKDDGNWHLAQNLPWQLQCPIWLSTESTDYWPLTDTAFWLKWRFWGQNTLGYHLTNLMLHVLVCFL